MIEIKNAYGMWPSITMASPGAAFRCLGALSRARALGLASYRAQSPVPGFLWEGALWQDQQTTLLTQPDPVRVAPVQKAPLGRLLLASRTILCCTSFYYQALSGDPSAQTLATAGGSLLLLGWLALALWASLCLISGYFFSELEQGGH